MPRQVVVGLSESACSVHSTQFLPLSSYLDSSCQVRLFLLCLFVIDLLCFNLLRNSIVQSFYTSNIASRSDLDHLSLFHSSSGLQLWSEVILTTISECRSYTRTIFQTKVICNGCCQRPSLLATLFHGSSHG